MGEHAPTAVFEASDIPGAPGAATTPPLARGMRVQAHPHRPRVLTGHPAPVSVRETRRGAATVYLAALWLSDPVFVTQPAGQARAVREGVRNVHAWVRGRVLDGWVAPTAELDRIAGHLAGAEHWVRVGYRPFTGDHFFALDDAVTEGAAAGAMQASPRAAVVGGGGVPGRRGLLRAAPAVPGRAAQQAAAAAAAKGAAPGGAAGRITAPARPSPVVTADYRGPGAPAAPSASAASA